LISGSYLPALPKVQGDQSLAVVGHGGQGARGDVEATIELKSAEAEDVRNICICG